MTNSVEYTFEDKYIKREWLSDEPHNTAHCLAALSTMQAGPDVKPIPKLELSISDGDSTTYIVRYAASSLEALSCLTQLRVTLEEARCLFNGGRSFDIARSFPVAGAESPATIKISSYMTADSFDVTMSIRVDNPVGTPWEHEFIMINSSGERRETRRCIRCSLE